MRVLYFLAHPQGIGGASKQLMLQAGCIKELKNEVLVVIPDDNEGKHASSFEVFCRALGLDYVSLYYSFATCIEEIDIIESDRVSEAVSAIINDFKPDLIHSVQLITAVEIAARKNKIPHLMNIYPVCSGMFDIKWENVFPRFHSADSLYTCDKWARGLGIESGCIRVIVPEENGEIAASEGDQCELLCVGVFMEYKRQLELLKFLESCRERELRVHVTFLGNNDTAYGKLCREYSEENGLKDHASFIGETDNVPGYMRKADALIHVSGVESYPGVVAEAMANRLFVIATKTGGLGELLTDGENGIFIKGFSADDIMDAFLRFSAMKEDGLVLEKITERAYHTYECHHSKNMISKELEKYYRSIIDDKSGSINGICDETINRISAFRKETDESFFCDYSRAHLWFLFHLHTGFKDKKSVFIWGAGNYGRIALRWCRILNWEVRGFIDSVKKGDYEGYPVFKPEEDLLCEADAVFVAVRDTVQSGHISSILENNGKKRNRDYFLVYNDPCIMIGEEWAAI
ncbi:MAG: glycosyltransferase [Lachnospiraceae bacterium]|nr:glycosyltransferase [Lachnospiraceae bacterium]